MQPQKVVGPTAGALKYDIITMVSVAGLNGPPVQQTSMLRLTSLITARYNWRLDELSVGQREMARMWSVNERTVKREMKRLTESGILICKRPGVKGRVGAYRLNLSEIAEISRELWPLVGPDFDYRMSERFAPVHTKIVPLRPVQTQTDDTQWGRVLHRLTKEDQNLADSWFTRLSIAEVYDGHVVLTAPSTFIQRYIETHLIQRLERALVSEIGQLNAISFRIVPT